MRISFLGKGGSGKTTLSAAFATYLHTINKNTVLVDADVNVHSNKLIDISDSDLKPISRNINKIADYVKGKRTDLGTAPFISATAPAHGSRFITLSQQDELLQENISTNKHGLQLMTIGTYEGNDIGFTCYHGKTDAYIIFLNHLLDSETDYLVVDSVTGIDNLGNALIYSYDLNILVVEPTKKSIEVYKDFIKGIQRFKYPVTIGVVGNKVETEEDKEFILKHISQEHLIGFVTKSEDMKLFDQGNKEFFETFVSSNHEIFEKILLRSQNITRDWDLYLNNIRNNFTEMAERYYNSYYGLDLNQHIDKEFSFADVLQKDKIL